MSQTSLAYRYSGVKVTCCGNVLKCADHKTPDENLQVILSAIRILFGFDLSISDDYLLNYIEENDGKVEFYRESA